MRRRLLIASVCVAALAALGFAREATYEPPATAVLADDATEVELGWVRIVSTDGARPPTAVGESDGIRFTMSFPRPDPLLEADALVSVAGLAGDGFLRVREWHVHTRQDVKAAISLLAVPVVVTMLVREFRWTRAGFEERGRRG